MKKTMKISTVAKKIITLVNAQGLDFETSCAACRISKGYGYKIVRAQYRTERGYNNLLAKARANKKALEKAKSLAVDSTKVEDGGKEVIVVETGYLLEKEFDGIQDKQIFIPAFCLKELQKLTMRYESAEEILGLYYNGHQPMTVVNLKGREFLFEEPAVPVKDRTYGVAAVCCYLWSEGFKVTLMTNGKEIENLVKEQGIEKNLTIVKI